jgi:isopentenyldiphosphate isomerase
MVQYLISEIYPRIYYKSRSKNKDLEHYIDGVVDAAIDSICFKKGVRSPTVRKLTLRNFQTIFNGDIFSTVL